MTIVLDEAYSGSTTDFGPIISKIIASKADALLGGGHYADTSTLTDQLHDQKTNLKWATLLVAPDSPKFAELGAAATNISVPSQWEPQVKFKPDFGPTAPQIYQRLQRAVRGRSGLSCCGRLCRGADLATRDRASQLN